jgi:hypothetical protein
LKRSSWVVLAVAALLLGLAGFLLLRGAGEPPRPEALIREALRDAEEAARARSVGGVMEVVSDDYKAAGMNKDRLRLLLANYVRQAQGIKYDVRVSAPQITFSRGRRDEALVMTTVSVFNTEGGENLWGGQPLALEMRRERQRRWLFFPEDRWRITSVVNLPPLPGFGGGEEGSVFGL